MNQKYDETTINYIINSVTKTSSQLSKELQIPATSIRVIRKRHNVKLPKSSVESLSQSDLDNIYNRCLNGESFTKIEKDYPVSRKIISKLMKEIYGYVSKRGKKFFTDEEEFRIYEECKNECASIIAKKYNCSKSTISKIYLKYVDKKDIGNKIYEYEKYFNTIDNPDKAYWLGFLAADGCVYKRKNGNMILSISVQSADKCLLENFYHCINKTKFANYNYMPKTNSYNIQIGSKNICNDLIKYNVCPKKTWIYKPYPLDDRLFFSYLRGYFDGDGSITIRNNNILPSNFRISICGNLETMMYFKNFLLKYNITSSLIEDKRTDKYTNKFYSIVINNTPSMYLFLKYIYKDSNRYTVLNRKKDKADSFIKMIEENNDNYKKYNLCVKEFYNCPLFK